MFSYLRIFFGISVIIIIGASIGLGYYYKDSANTIITRDAEQSNIALGKSIEKTVWADSMETMNRFAEIKPEERGQYQEYFDFGNKIRNMMKGVPVVQINIFSLHDERIFATNQLNNVKNDNDDGITGYNDQKISPILAVSSNHVISQLVQNTSFVDNAGKRVNGIVVRTVIPLQTQNKLTKAVETTGSIELFFDVTQAANTLKKFQYYAAAFVGFIFLSLYVMLISISQRAERIIEKQHETNLELAQAKSTAESENEQKSQFLANISHELRTPLNAIIGFSEIIKDEVMGPFENEQYKNYIKDIHSSGVHLLSLINDILDYSKAEAGKLDLEYEDIDLTKLISSSLRFQEPRAASANVNLVKEFLNERIVIRSDAKRLKQVLLNLLSNAVKFTPPNGTVKVTAWIDAANKHMVNIEVRDSGIGIAPKDIAKALAPFGQVDSELSRKYEGTGLGLPLTKKFVELLGGVLQLESEVTKGTTVTITMPINNQPDSITPN